MKKIFKISPILLIGATLAAPITTLSACSQNTSVTISVEGDDANKIQLSSNKAELNKDLSIKVESIDEVKTKVNITSIKINNQQVTNYIYDAAAKLLNISAQYVTGNIIINAYISQPVITHNVQLAFEVEGLQLLTFSVEDKKDAIISLKISNFLKMHLLTLLLLKIKVLFLQLLILFLIH